MLSRIANNLYWAARYLERIEHIARYVPVTYFAGLDGPEVIDKQYTLRSINEMCGSLPEDQTFESREVLYNVTFDKTNSSSIIACVTSVRENCRGARDMLSTELWESVNRLFHFVLNYEEEKFLRTHMQDFMLKLQEHVGLCKARIDSTLIQNQVWSILKLGLYIERSMQIIRIITIKLEDLASLNMPDNIVVNTYETGNMLKSLESYDMNRKFYKKAVEQRNALEFLFFNEKFPRSLYFCVCKISEHLATLNMREKGKNKSLKLIAEHLKCELKYSEIDEIEDIFEEIEKYKHELFLLNDILVTNYFVNP